MLSQAPSTRAVDLAGRGAKAKRRRQRHIWRRRGRTGARPGATCYLCFTSGYRSESKVEGLCVYSQPPSSCAIPFHAFQVLAADAIQSKLLQKSLKVVERMSTQNTLLEVALDFKVWTQICFAVYCVTCSSAGDTLCDATPKICSGELMRRRLTATLARVCSHISFICHCSSGTMTQMLSELRRAPCCRCGSSVLHWPATNRYPKQA